MLFSERFIYKMDKYLAFYSILCLYTPAAVPVRSNLFTGNMVGFSAGFSGMVTSTSCPIVITLVTCRSDDEHNWRNILSLHELLYKGEGLLCGGVCVEISM